MSNRRPGWMLSFAALLAAGWLAPARAGDEPTTVYTGTLGKQAIVMELPSPHSGILFDARYFYTRHRIDIGIGGPVAADGHLTLEEDGTSNDFELARQPDGGWKGTWKNPQGQSLPVLLHPAVLPPLPAGASDFLKQARANKPYVYLRLRTMALVRDKRQSFMGHRLQWWREPGSGIRLFQIEDGYPASQRQRINQALMSELWGNVDEYYGCVNGNGLGDGGYTLSVKPTFLGASAISLVESFDIYCGGAHPNSGRSAINLDAHTGEKLWLGDILWTGKKRPFHYPPIPGEPDNSPTRQNMLDRWADYRDRVFVPWLVRQLKKRYPKQMASGKDQCGYADDPDIWMYADWYLAPKGVFFIPYFPHVVESCAETDYWSLLPYSELGKHTGRLRLDLP